MRNNSIIFTHIIIGIVIIMLVFFPLTPVALAQKKTIPPVPPNPVFVPTQDFPKATQDFKQSWLDALWEVFVTVLKQQIIGQMVDQTVEWIQGKGKPRFVTDWGSLVADAGQAMAGEFAKELGLGFLCQSFDWQLKVSLFPVKKFSKKATCTLEDMKININKFRKDFRDGSWVAFSESWKPQNNLFGVAFMASEELELRAGKASGANWSEAMAGGGFLSTKVCKKNKETGEIDKLKCKIITPGDTIGKAAAEAVGADFNFIINASDVEAIASTITAALINRIMKEGIGLAGAKPPPEDPSGGYVDLGTDNCRGLTGKSLEACQNYRLAFGREFQLTKEGFISSINTTLQPNISAKNTILSSIEILQSYVDWAKLAYETLSGLQYISICRGPSGSENIVKTDLIKNLQASIDQEKKLIDRLKTDQINNQQLIDKLQNAQNQITALLPTEIEKMLPIFDAISDELDATMAENFKSSIMAENTEIYNRTKANLSQFDKQVKACQESR